MSATRRLALTVTLALATVVAGATAVLAQGGSPNPSGGTQSIQPGLDGGLAPISLGDYMPRGFSIDLGARSWISGFAASRYAVLATNHRLSVRTLSAVAPRRVWAR
jgi:hypothetical protein